jgi:hypothetical protein
MHIRSILLLFGLLFSSHFVSAQPYSKQPLLAGLKPKTWQVGAYGDFTNHVEQILLIPNTSNPITGYSKTAIAANLNQLGTTVTVGYIPVQYWQIGLYGNYTWQSDQAAYSDTIHGTQLSTGAFSRYYMPLSKQVSFYPEIGFGYSNAAYQSKPKALYYDPKTLSTYPISANQLDVSGTSGYLGIGFLIFTNKHITIDAGARYHWATQTGTNRWYDQYTGYEGKTNLQYTRSGIGARLGLQFFLFK